MAHHQVQPTFLSGIERQKSVTEFVYIRVPVVPLPVLYLIEKSQVHLKKKKNNDNERSEKE